MVLLNITMKSSITIDEYSMKMIVLPSTLRVSILGAKRRVEQKIDYTRDDKYTMLFFDASQVIDPEDAFDIKDRIDKGYKKLDMSEDATIKDRKNPKESNGPFDPNNEKDQKDQDKGSKDLYKLEDDENTNKNQKLQTKDLSEFEFQWFCRLSPSSTHGVVRNTSMVQSPLKCSSRTNWTRLMTASGPVANLSTKYLASKQEYQFKVVVTKAGRLPGQAVQSVKITSSKLPKGVKIK